VCGTLSDGAHHGGGLNGQDAYTGRILPVAYSLSPGREGCGDQTKDDLYVAEQNTSRTITTGCGAEPTHHQGGMAVVQPLAFDARQTDVCVYGDKSGSLDTDPGTIGVCVTGDRTHSLTTRSASGEDGTGRGTPIVPSGMSVRRLTPTECERLQGFPDGHTAIPWKGKPASDCPDGPRYRALGNSMAVNVMRWIGRRIEMVDAL